MYQSRLCEYFCREYFCPPFWQRFAKMLRHTVNAGLITGNITLFCSSITLAASIHCFRHMILSTWMLTGVIHMQPCRQGPMCLSCHQKWSSSSRYSSFYRVDTYFFIKCILSFPWYSQLRALYYSIFWGCKGVHRGVIPSLEICQALSFASASACISPLYLETLTLPPLFLET